MKRLPDRPNLEHLGKQAKDLVRFYRNGDPDAIARFRESLPVATSRSDSEILVLELRLHDAQSCVAREFGFRSWADLRTYVRMRAMSHDDRASQILHWLNLVYPGDVTGATLSRANPRIAMQILSESPELAQDDPYLACAIGELQSLREQTQTDHTWVNRPGGPLNLPSLVAVTQSCFLQIPEFRERLHRSARFLLSAGADPNQQIGSRWSPGSLREPDAAHPLSALYGASGQNRDPELTKMLLEAGADPNDNESLYHSVDSLECARLLLEHGARVVGSNAFYRVLDFDNLAALELLLQHGADPNELPRNVPLTDWGSPLMWAIRRRRSRDHIRLLLKAGADPGVRTPNGTGAYSLAVQFGLVEVAEVLREFCPAEPLPDGVRFIAACARADEAEARRIRAARPDLPASLSKEQLRLLPDMVAEGGDEGAKVMVKLGWPIAVRGGDWAASALNHAVFRGNSPMTRFLLEYGASWREMQGFDDNVCGTLSWASCNQPVDGGDWVGCAEALLDHGMPEAVPDPEESGVVLVDGNKRRFSDEVRELLLEWHRK